MDTFEKLKILADGAKYDVSCASSGSERRNPGVGVGNTAYSGICHSFAADGRCISLLKILLTNICIFDCRYCINRRSNDIPRAFFTPQEIADLTINFYRRNYIEGLFLSSGVVKNADYTMELFFRTLKLLRIQQQFRGYIHVKIIPGASLDLVRKVGFLADRVSVNIELPSQDSLQRLAPDKTKANIVTPMRLVKDNILATKDERKVIKHTPAFVPAGQSTQMIIAASPENDAQILRLGESLYNTMRLKRVYYSAYVPVNSDPNLPQHVRPPMLREHRLYQADWLLRFYGFTSDELFDPQHPNLLGDFDPKVNWALRHLELFPVEINTVDYEMLLRVPGIGLLSAQKIIFQRRVATIRYEDLKKIGVVLKRARYFITVNGQYYGKYAMNERQLSHALSEHHSEKQNQLELDFSEPARLPQRTQSGACA